MRDGPGDREGDAPRWASLLDPVVATRVLADVQAQGVRAASDLVDRLVRSVDGARERAEHAPSPDLGGSTRAGASDAEARRLIETWIELLQDAAGSIARIAAGAGADAPDSPPRLHVDGTDIAPRPLVLAVDETGAITVGGCEIWLHNGAAEPVGPLTVRCGDLQAPDGSVLGASLVAHPAAIDELPARSSRGISLSLEPHGVLSPGAHRGIVQVEGAGGVWLPVEVRVAGPAA